MSTAPDDTNLAQLVDELRATVEMKDHLLQMVSHEMRTPLVSITNFSGSIISAWDVLSEDDKREYVGIINQQATRLSRLVHDLLAVARLEAGRLRTMREPVQLREVAEQTAAELATPDAPEIQVRCPEDLVVLADRDHVKQILVNFVSNAIKYGREPIVIDCERRGEEIALWVADGGDGLSEEFVPHLFEKFSQQRDGDHTTGSGLGMSIVRGLAHAQRGEAWYVRTEDDVRFGVTLPT